MSDTPMDAPTVDTTQPADGTAPYRVRPDGSVEYTVPVPSFRIDERRHALAGVVDRFSAEEIAKARARAERFGVTVDPFKDTHGMTAEEYVEHIAAVADEAAAAAEAGEPAPVGENEFPQIFEPEAVAKLPAREIELETSAFDLQAEHRWDTVHLVGSKMLRDNMKTSNVLDFFSEYSPSHVEWISDYRCNIVFADALAAKRALMMLSRPRDSDVAAAMRYIINNEVPVNFSQDDLHCVVWRPALVHEPPQRSLSMRVATVLDVKGYGADRTRSVFYRRNLDYVRKLEALRSHQIKAHRRAVAAGGDTAELVAPVAPVIRTFVQARKEGTLPSGEAAAAAVEALGPDEQGLTRKGRGYLSSSSGSLSGGVPLAEGPKSTVKVIRRDEQQPRGRGTSSFAPRARGAGGDAVEEGRSVRGRGGSGDRYQPYSLAGPMSEKRETAYQRHRERRVQATAVSVLAERPRLNLVPAGGAGASSSGAARGIYADIETPSEGTSAMFARITSAPRYLEDDAAEKAAAKQAAEAEAAAAAAAAAAEAMADVAASGGVGMGDGLGE